MPALFLRLHSDSFGVKSESMSLISLSKYSSSERASLISFSYFISSCLFSLLITIYYDSDLSRPFSALGNELTVKLLSGVIHE